MDRSFDVHLTELGRLAEAHLRQGQALQEAGSRFSAVAVDRDEVGHDGVAQVLQEWLRQHGEALGGHGRVNRTMAVALHLVAGTYAESDDASTADLRAVRQAHEA